MINNDKCLVDARWMTGRLRGMGRYAHQMVEPIQKHCIFATNLNSSGEFAGKVIRRGLSFFPLWEQKTFPELFDLHMSRWMLCPYNTAPIKKLSGDLILVVHDLIFMESWLKLPPSVSLYQNFGRLYRKFIVPRAIKRARVLVTVSEYTKRLLVDRFDIEAWKIKVIPNSLDTTWFELADVPIDRRENYILTVSGEAPSKNIKRLLSAYGLYKQRIKDPLRLKIVGVSEKKHKDFFKICENLGIKDSVDFIGYVEDSELKLLYIKARAFIFPSLHEGFGIPLLEAMAAGVPVACSNSTSLPEVVGDAALQFDPLDVSAIAESIFQLTNSEALSSKLIRIGKSRVQRYKVEQVSLLFKEFWADLGFAHSSMESDS